MRIIFFLAAAALASAFPSAGVAATMLQPRDQALQWRDIATPGDRTRLRGWRSAWVEGLRQAWAAGHGRAIASEGALLQPDAALDRVAPPPGSYHCRTLRIGAQGRRTREWATYPPFRCRIEGGQGGVLAFAKLGGMQRPIGHLYPENDRRMIFLGTLQLGDERQSLRYGSDAERNAPALLERVGEARWRLVFPRPSFGAIVDVVELVPAEG